jgi:hypothetical protein
VLAAFCLTKSLLCNVAKFLSGLLSHASGHPSVSRRFEQFKVAFIRMSWQHIRTHIRVRKIIRFPSHTHIWERQLHPFERQGNTVRTRSLIRQDVEKNCNHPDIRATQSRRSPYYENCVHQSCNSPDARATSSRRGLNMESVKRVMERRLHSFPSRRPQLASGCSLEKTESMSI